MTDRLTPEDVATVHKLVKRLEGTADDFDTVCEEELNITTNQHLCAFFDTKLWKCEDCDYWTPTSELRNGFCFGCAKSFQD